MGSVREEIEGLEDKQLTCKICGEDFKFSRGEAMFYQDRGLVSPPKRCPACRRKRRTPVQEEVSHENG